VKRLLGSVVAVAAAALTACTGSGTDNPTITSTIDTTVTQTATQTRTATATFRPKPATSVVPLPPGQAPAKGEVEKRCPYIASSPDQNPDVNVADIEGDHVYRTTVLTGMKPVGCRFYFYAGPFEAIADIVTQTFSSAAAAHDALILTGNAGTQADGEKDGISRGIDSVVYRTRFFGPDGDTDWACAFAKGKVLVIVHTQQENSSRNALYLAQAIAPKI
jgi:hypothetical protein